MDMITTIATIPAILALVNLAKGFGVVGRWSTLLAVLLGVVVQAAEYGFLAEALTRAGWFESVTAGLILGLSAAGLYDVAVTVGDGPEPRRALDETEQPGLPSTGA